MFSILISPLNFLLVPQELLSLAKRARTQQQEAAPQPTTQNAGSDSDSESSEGSDDEVCINLCALFKLSDIMVSGLDS